MIGRLDEGDTVELRTAKRSYDHEGRPCREVDSAAAVPILARNPWTTEYTPRRRRTRRADD